MLHREELDILIPSLKQGTMWQTTLYILCGWRKLELNVEVLRP
jgi:hypothetical protein